MEKCFLTDEWVNQLTKFLQVVNDMLETTGVALDAIQISNDLKRSQQLATNARNFIRQALKTEIQSIIEKMEAAIIPHQ